MNLLTVNPQHLVTPDRVIVPMPKRFEAAPGVMPFHRMLEAENLVSKPEIQRVEQVDRVERAEIARPRDTFEPSKAIGLLPKLGEVLAVTPIALAAIKTEQVRQVQLPATGRVLDLYL